MRTVLVIDDEVDLLNLLVSDLKDAGFRALGANSAEDARQVLAKEGVHAVLCDIRMPKESGLEFLRSLRATGNDMPFVFITGVDLAENMIQAVRLGASDFLLKPEGVYEVGDVMARAVDQGVRLSDIHSDLLELDKCVGDDASAQKSITNIRRNLKQIQRLTVIKR
jgi:two-component system alkaline phosphatase synthesis response regulator PhoP